MRPFKWLCVLTLFAAACGGDGALLIATITSNTSLTTSTVALDVTVGGKTRRFDVPVETGTIPPGVEVGIQFAPETIGDVNLVATANGKTATGAVTLAKGETERVTLTLGASVPTDLGGDLPTTDLPTTDLPAPDLTPADLPATADLPEADLEGLDLTPPSPDLIIPAPVLSADPNSAGFNKITTGSRSAGLKIKVTNDGNATTATLSVSLPAPFFKENDGCTGMTLSPGGNCTVDLYFQPSALGNAGGTATISDLGAATVLVTLSGEGVAPSQLQATPPSGSASWANLFVNAMGPTVSFSIKNTGGVASGTLSVAITSAGDRPNDKNQFTKTSDTCTGVTLAASGGAGDTCVIDLRYTPTIHGAHLAALEVQEMGGGLLVVSLGGNALRPPNLSITPVTTSDFGGVAVGKSAKRTFHVDNSGDVAAAAGNLTFGFEPVGGPYTISSNGCSSGIAASPQPGCDIEVTFTPAAVGAASARSLKVAFATTGASSTATEALSGAGITPVALTLTGNAFTDTQLGMSSTRTFTLTNAGDEIATNIVIGEASTHFSIGTNNCDEGVTLAKNQSCTVDVIFAPAAPPGAKTASLTATASEGSATPLTMTGNAFECTDPDADGRFGDARCGGVVDCDNNDPDNWDKCGTCVDSDGDGFFANCNRYVNRGSECASTANDSNLGPSPDGLDATDDDCDGTPMSVDDQHGFFVDVTLGNDSNPGTMAAPVATVAKAMTLVSNGKRAIFVAASDGTLSYSLPASTTRQIYIFGGFSAPGWTRGNGTSALSRPATGNTVQLTGTAIAASLSPKLIVSFDQMDISASDGTAVAANSAMVYLTKSTVRADQREGNVGVDVSNRARLNARNTDLLALGTALNVRTNGIADVADCQIRGVAAPSVIPVNSGAVSVDQGTLVAEKVTLKPGRAAGTSSGLAIGNNGSATLQASTIDAQTSDGNYSFGVYQSGGVVVLKNSIVRSGTAGTHAAYWQEGGGTFKALSSVFSSPGGTGVVMDSTQASILINDFMEGTPAALIKGVGNGTPAIITNCILRTPSSNPPLTVTPSGAGQVRLRQNMFYSQGGGAGYIVDSAGLWKSGDCGAWTRCQEENSSQLGDCLIDSTFHIASGSVCDGNGLNGTAENGNEAFPDIDGVLRPTNAWDIGPDEL